MTQTISPATLGWTLLKQMIELDGYGEGSLCPFIAFRETKNGPWQVKVSYVVHSYIKEIDKYIGCRSIDKTWVDIHYYYPKSEYTYEQGIMVSKVYAEIFNTLVKEN